jgi:hypothetical protein
MISAFAMTTESPADAARVCDLEMGPDPKTGARNPYRIFYEN